MRVLIIVSTAEFYKSVLAGVDVKVDATPEPAVESVS
jgi:hypothetical protein